MTTGRKKANRRRGYQLAEVPAGLILLILGIFIPLLIISSITYRVSLLWFATRDSCLKAAKAPTFTEANNRAQTNFNRNIAGFPGISGTATIQIMIKPLSGGPPTFSSTALPASSIDTNNNIYFIRETANGTLNPLVQMSSYFGKSIPGLTGPFNVQTRFEALVESPNGLSQ
ncbi:MAG TPA: hypothetical protein V6D17_15125 [Candidatus Obscuribacterales bacterium]